MDMLIRFEFTVEESTEELSSVFVKEQSLVEVQIYGCIQYLQPTHKLKIY